MQRAHHVAIIVLVAFIVGVALYSYATRHSNSALATNIGKLYVRPSDNIQLKKDDMIRIAIRVTPETQIDTVTATLKYDTAKLEYQEVSYDTSPFPVQIPATTTTDTVTVQAARFGGETVSKDSLVATLAFRALKDGEIDVALTQGNTALAGVALNPTLNVAPKIVTVDEVVQNTSIRAPGMTATPTLDSTYTSPTPEETSEPQSADTSRSSTSTVDPVLRVPNQLSEDTLKVLGQTESQAQESAPKLTFAIGLFFISLITGTLIWIVIKRSRSRRAA